MSLWRLRKILALYKNNYLLIILIIIGCGYTRELNCLLRVPKQAWINKISNHHYSITAMMS